MKGPFTSHHYAGPNALWIIDTRGAAFGKVHADGTFDDHASEVPAGDPMMNGRSLCVGGDTA